MALPFIAGIAIGAGVALLFTKRKAVKEMLENSAECFQKGISEGLDKGKNLSNKALQCAKNGLESILETKSSVAKDSTNHKENHQ